MKKLTVADLKNALKDIPDDMSVVTGWQFHPVLQAKVEETRINGVYEYGFCLIDDPDLVD